MSWMTRHFKMCEGGFQPLYSKESQMLGGYEKIALACLHQLLDLTDKLADSDRTKALELFSNRVSLKK